MNYLYYFLDPPKFFNLHAASYDEQYFDTPLILSWIGYSSLVFYGSSYNWIYSLSILFISFIVLVIFSYFIRPYLVFLSLQSQGLPSAPYKHFNFFNGASAERNSIKAGDSQKLSAASHGIFLNQIGPFPRLIVCDSDACLEILKAKSKHWCKGDLNKKTFGPALGTEGLLNSEEPIHNAHRQLMNPFFHYSNLIELKSVFAEAASKACSKWVQQSANGPINIYLEVSHQVLSMLTAVCFGEAFDEAMAEAVHHHIEEALVIQQTRFNSIYQVMPALWQLPNALKRRVAEHSRVLDKLCDELLDRRERGASHGQPALKASDPLDTLLTMNLSRDALRSHVKILLFAGHDTTSNSIAWTIVELARNADIMKTLVDELDRLIPGNEIDWPSLQLAHFTYLDCVLKETLRLYAPVPTLPRQVLHAHTMKTAQSSFSLWPGVHSTIVLPRMNQWEKHFKDAKLFNPARWSASDSKNRGGQFFIPFGLGGRQCIGQQLALIQAKIILITIFKSYTVYLLPNQTFKPVINVATSPSEPIMIDFKARK